MAPDFQVSTLGLKPDQSSDECTVVLDYRVFQNGYRIFVCHLQR